MLDWGYEARETGGYTAVCGIDEAGRGPLAGPVVAAAVILPEGCMIEGLDDSKKLSSRKREQMFDKICEKAIAYGIAEVDHTRIDEINILQATFEAMRGAAAALTVPADFALVDGNRSPGLSIPERCIVDGDAIVPSIAAASILAKVTRDHFMELMAAEYPGYSFERHKGYGTKAHYAAILEYGVSPIHRRSFLKKLFQKYPHLKE